jgi:hypothetical protein
MIGLGRPTYRVKSGIVLGNPGKGLSDETKINDVFDDRSCGIACRLFQRRRLASIPGAKRIGLQRGRHAGPCHLE